MAEVFRFSKDIEDDGPPLSPKEAAQKLGYSKSTIYTMLDKKILGCVRVPGMDIRIFPSHIREFKRRYECPAQPSNDPTTGSNPSQDDETGTSPGQNTSKPRSSARGLRLRKKATKAKMNRTLAKMQKRI